MPIEPTLKEPDPDLHDLLVAYAETRRQAGRLARITWVPLSERQFARHLRVPLASGFVRFLLAHRNSRVVGELRRRWHERAALGPDPNACETELAALDHFAASVPSVPYRRLWVGVFLAALLVAYGLSNGVFRSDADARGIARLMEGLLTLDPNAAADAFDSFGLRGALGAIFTLVLALALVATPFALSFRLTRAVLNTYPGGADGIEHEFRTGRPSHARGVYRVEARAFTRFDEAPPQEFPFDLAVRGLALLLALWGALVLSVLAVAALRDDADVLGVGAFALLALAAALILGLVFDSVVNLRRIAHQRRRALLIDGRPGEPPTRLLPRSTRWLASTVLVFSLTGGVAMFAAQEGGRVSPPLLDARVTTVRLARHVTLRQWLTTKGVPTGNYSRRQLAAPGVIIQAKLDLQWPADKALGLRHVLYNARTGRRVWSSPSVLVGRRAKRSDLRVAAGFDFRELALLRGPGVRRHVPARLPPESIPLSTWLRSPDRPGRYFVRVTLSEMRGEVPLAIATTAGFRLGS